jgi:hypothetical protein
MLLQAALEAAPARVTPVPGKGALGTRWPRQVGTLQTQSWVTRGLHRGEGVMQTPPRRGEGCASTAVSRRGGRPALRNGVQSRGQNRTREIRPSGIVEGFRKRGQLEHHLHAARAPDFYLDNRMHDSMWRREANPGQSARPRGRASLPPTLPSRSRARFVIGRQLRWVDTAYGGLLYVADSERSVFVTRQNDPLERLSRTPDSHRRGGAPGGGLPAVSPRRSSRRSGVAS